MDLNILLVDDLADDRAHLTELIDAYFGKGGEQQAVRLDTFSSAAEALAAFAPGKYQLAFLDICMDEMTGIDLARQMRAKDAELLIVFQTTSREYAFDAFPIHPFDYLIKPCTAEAMDHVLGEALRLLTDEEPRITVSISRDTLEIPLGAISTACSEGRSVVLTLTNGRRIQTTELFRDIQGKLAPDPRFLQINRGILINMDHVLSPHGDSMKMKDGTEHPIRVNGRAAVLSAFSQYMIGQVRR